MCECVCVCGHIVVVVVVVVVVVLLLLLLLLLSLRSGPFLPTTPTDHTPNFPLKHAQKDLAFSLTLAQQLGVEAKTAAAANGK
jgi:hypothetical protein